MAKILVPETGSQLSLSFGSGGGQAGTNSVPNTSAKLRQHIFERTHSELSDVFKPLNFAMIAKAIKDSARGKISGSIDEEVYFVGKDRRAINLRPLIVNIIDESSPKAIVNLNMDLRGPSRELRGACLFLLLRLNRSRKMRNLLGITESGLAAWIPINPIARIDVGTLDVPPVTHSFVLREEIAHLLPQLTALGRPYQVVAA